MTFVDAYRVVAELGELLADPRRVVRCTPCDRCGAVGGEFCRTRSGGFARTPHAPRRRRAAYWTREGRRRLTAWRRALWSGTRSPAEVADALRRSRIYQHAHLERGGAA